MQNRSLGRSRARLATLMRRRKARAGLYAQMKYETGLRAYRRRMRIPIIIGVSPLVLFVLVLSVTRRFEWWSFVAGGALAAAVAAVMFVRDEPPQHVMNWRRGAEGERKTERALKPLERQGWKVEHDIQREGRGNLDHVVTGPKGVYLLETKHLSGTITFESGLLVVRQFDDPDEVWRYTTLAPRLRGLAKELSTRLRNGSERGPWVSSVVVIWGNFDSAPVEHDDVLYLRGDMLRTWLEARGG